MTIDCSYANYDDGTYCTNPPNGMTNRVGSESPKGDGKWTQADLGGNTSEWTLDWYQGAYNNPCNDCAELSPATSRVVRGGNFLAASMYLRSANRGLAVPALRSNAISIRCARLP
jgi:formylglycine-generating enzyme